MISGIFNLGGFVFLVIWSFLAGRTLYKPGPTVARFHDSRHGRPDLLAQLRRARDLFGWAPCWIPLHPAHEPDPHLAEQLLPPVRAPDVVE